MVFALCKACLSWMSLEYLNMISISSSSSWNVWCMIYDVLYRNEVIPMQSCLASFLFSKICSLYAFNTKRSLTLRKDSHCSKYCSWCRMGGEIISFLKWADAEFSDTYRKTRYSTYLDIKWGGLQSLRFQVSKIRALPSCTGRTAWQTAFRSRVRRSFDCP